MAAGADSAAARLRKLQRLQPQLRQQPIISSYGISVKLTGMLCRLAGEKVVAEGGSGGLKFLLVAGRPIGEPIVQYGPFVMNSVSCKRRRNHASSSASHTT